MHKFKRRLETLEASGGSGIHCVVRFQGQTKTEALVAHQRMHALETTDMERGLLVFINKPFAEGARLNR